MSKYTTEVRFICEESAGLDHSKGYTSINQIITDAMPKVFDFEFPIFDETYRPVLERKILKHYYTREIGMETVGLWKHFLDMRLNEIMPYYNKLYESELLQFNPLYDVDLTTDHSGSGTSASEGHKSDNENTNNTRTDNLTRTDDTTRTDDFTRTDNLNESVEGTRTENLLEETDNTRTDNLSKVTQDSGTQGESGSDVNKNTRWDIYSDTPQGALTNVQNETYLTNARKIVDDGTGSTHSSTTTFGKKVTETDTGTVKDVGSKENTGTVENEESKTNTGTVKNQGTEKHTGTIKNTGNVQNIGTRNQTVGTTEDISTTDEYLNHVIGKTGGTSYSRLLSEYRETFLNIDMLIIEDLSDLFMQLW